MIKLIRDILALPFLALGLLFYSIGVLIGTRGNYRRIIEMIGVETVSKTITKK